MGNMKRMDDVLEVDFMIEATRRVGVPTTWFSKGEKDYDPDPFAAPVSIKKRKKMKREMEKR